VAAATRVLNVQNSMGSGMVGLGGQEVLQGCQDEALPPSRFQGRGKARKRWEERIRLQRREKKMGRNGASETFDTPTLLYMKTKNGAALSKGC